MRKKVTVVGAGNVGATTAHWLAADELADVVLVDVVEGVPQGKSLDLAQALSIEGADVRTDRQQRLRSDRRFGYRRHYGRLPAQARDEPRRPAASRTAEIVGAATAAAVKRSPDTILIVVSNPLDAMCEVARRVSGFPRERIIGMAGVLDSSRFATFIARELKVSVENVTAFVLGGHGDQMVPVPRYSTVAGVPITELWMPRRSTRIVKRTAGGGGEIVALLKTGSAYYAPARSTAEMVGAILKNKHKIMPCAAFLQGEYGIEGLFVGVPCQLGARGLEAIFEVKLHDERARRAAAQRRRRTRTRRRPAGAGGERVSRMVHVSVGSPAGTYSVGNSSFFRYVVRLVDAGLRLGPYERAAVDVLAAIPNAFVDEEELSGMGWRVVPATSDEDWPVLEVTPQRLRSALETARRLLWENAVPGRDQRPRDRQRRGRDRERPRHPRAGRGRRASASTSATFPSSRAATPRSERRHVGRRAERTITHVTTTFSSHGGRSLMLRSVVRRAFVALTGWPPLTSLGFAGARRAPTTARRSLSFHWPRRPRTFRRRAGGDDPRRAAHPLRLRRPRQARHRLRQTSR